MRYSPLLLAFACKSPATPTPVPSEADTDTDTDADTDADTDTDTDTDVSEPVGTVLLPGRPLVRVGSTVQLRARTLFDDGSWSGTTTVDWTDPLSPLGALSDDGLFTAGTAGDLRIDTDVDGVPQSVQVHIYDSSVTVESLALLPPTATVPLDEVVVYSAEAQLSDGAHGDITDACTWSSSDTAVAAAAPNGQIAALGVGSTTITADCDGTLASGTLTVQASAVDAPALQVTGLQTIDRGSGVFDYVAQITNHGGYVGGFVVDFVADAAIAPDGIDERVAVGGLATGETRDVTVRTTYTDLRPATLQSWVTVDGPGWHEEADTSDNRLSTATALAADVQADIEVEFGGITVFGPTDAGVIFYVTNHGPTAIDDLTIHFERDQPAVTLLTELDPASAERTEVIPTLAVDETWTWLFDYDQVPFDHTWDSCGFVPVDGWSEADTSNNFACGTFPAY